MATNFPAIWNNVLNQPGTQNVDLLASFNEEGINHYLEQHHKNDNHVYHKTVTKKFRTQTDEREFKVNLKITSPVQLQFPPYKDTTISSQYVNKNKWYKLDSKHEGPEIQALMDDQENKIQVYCNKVEISIEWPKLNPKPGDNSPWIFKLNPITVLAEAFAILKNTPDGYFVSLIPTIIKFDVLKSDISLGLLELKKELPEDEVKLFDECEEKITDLFVIALNILSTEQTPKLVRNIGIPVTVIKERPLLPSVLRIADNCLTVGCGIDKAKAERSFKTELDSQMTLLYANLMQDIEAAGGFTKMVSKNNDVFQYDDLNPKYFDKLKLKSEEEISALFIKTSQYINALENDLTTIQGGIQDTKRKIKSKDFVNDAYAIGINEYFFDTIVSSVIPAPKHECSGEVNIAAAKGKACYWVKFFNPDVTIIQQPVALKGAVSIDIGGSLEACIRKFWDCSWRWECGHLAISVKGRPNITIKLVAGNGVQVAANMGGNLYLDTNLPFPFNVIINAVSSVIGKFVIAMINIVLKLLSFYIIYPDITLPQQKTKLKLRNFDSFYYERPPLEGNGSTKNKFIGYKGGLTAEV